MQNIARPHANKCSSSRANLSSGNVFLISSWVPPLLKPLLARSALREEICVDGRSEVLELPWAAKSKACIRQFYADFKSITILGTLAAVYDKH